MAKNLVWGPILAPLTQIWAQKFFRGFYMYQMLDIVANYHCMQVQGKLMTKLEKMAKNLVLVPILAPLAQIWPAKFFFKNLAPRVTRCYGQLSSCTISEKINDPISRKLSDGWTDIWTRVISQDALRLTSSVQHEIIEQFYINNFVWYQSSPDNCCLIIALQYTGNKFQQPGLQENKYNNNDNVGGLGQGGCRTSRCLRKLTFYQLTMIQKNHFKFLENCR